MEVDGRRRRGKPRRRWRECIEADLKEKELVGDEFIDRRTWRRLVRNSDPV